MSDTHRCPNCGRTMSLVPGWHGKKVRCPGCNAISVAGAPAEQITASPSVAVIHFTCQECERPLQAPASRAGGYIICPKCGFQIAVPGAAPAPALAEGEPEQDGGMYRLTEPDEPAGDPTADHCPCCEAVLRPDAVRCPACRRNLRKPGRSRATEHIGTTWTVRLSPFEWQRFTVDAGKSGQPILTRTRCTWFSSALLKPVDLAKYACLGLENEVVRERGVNWLAFTMFLFTCGIIWLLLADTGNRSGAWVLRLNRAGEFDGMILYRNRNLNRVHAIRDVLTAVAGLRVGRAY